MNAMVWNSEGRQGKGKRASRMRENRQMSGTEASPCLFKCDGSTAACILGDPKLLAAEIQDVLVTPLAVFSNPSPDHC